MKKKLTSYLVIALILALSLTLFTGCGNSQNADNSTNAPAPVTKTIRIGASSTPHAEILEQAKSTLSAEGYTLDIIIYDDYVLPNQALVDGAIDANYFQHTPYLNSYNDSNGTDLIAAAIIHYEPFGIYGNGLTDLGSLAAGATIIIPADDSNETRALLLLQQEGLITLPEGTSAAEGVSTLDIVDNGGYDIVPVQADTVAAQLSNSADGTIAVINGNYALAAGLNIADALATEAVTGDAALTYGNIIACRSQEDGRDEIKALIAALQTEDVAKYIEDTYNGAVVPMF